MALLGRVCLLPGMPPGPPVTGLSNVWRRMLSLAPELVTGMLTPPLLLTSLLGGLKLGGVGMRWPIMTGEVI